MRPRSSRKKDWTSKSSTCRTLAPLDKPAILASVKKTSKAIVLHEASRTGGIGGEIAAMLAEEAFEWLDAPVIRIASIDTPVPYSPPLEDYYLPQTKDVVEAQRASWRPIGAFGKIESWRRDEH